MSLSRTSCPSPRRFFGGEWTLSSKRVPEPRYACAYSSLGEDRHLLIGGKEHTYSHLRTVLEFNSTMEVFSSHTPLPKERQRDLSAAIAIDDQRLLVVGGSNASSIADFYDTKTREWSHGPHLNVGRDGHTCVSAKNKVYAVGGWDIHGRAVDSIEVLELSVRNPSWRILPQRLKKTRTKCQAVVDPKNPNNIIVVGGFDGKGEVLSCCEVVSLQEGQQTRTIPSLMAPRGMHAMVLVENRFLVVMGGSNVIHCLVASVEVLDLDEAGEEQRWHPLPPMRTTRWGLAAFYCPRNHKIVVAGGSDGGVWALDTIEEMEVKVEIEEGRSGLALANGPHCQPLPRPPPFTELPAGFMDVAHQTKIESWLKECDEQMATFLSKVDARDKEMEKEREDNERAAKAYVAKGRSLQKLARGVLASMRNTSTTETSQPVACCAVAQDGEVEAEEGEEQKESCVGVSSDGGDPEYVCVGEGDSKRLRL